MRGRDLPGSRTWTMARPAGIVAEPHADHVVYDVPGSRAAALDHRIALDEPPADLAPWFAIWRSAHAGKGLPAAFVSWETRDEAVFTAPEGVVLRALRCLMIDLPLDPDLPDGVRPIDDIEAAIALDPTQPRDWAAWYWSGLRDRMDAGEGTLLGQYDGDALIGTAGIFWGTGREARLAAVVTAPEHRGKGVAQRLVQAAVATYQADSMGITYAVCTEGSVAERMYRRVGFRRVTRFWLASRAEPGSG